MLGSDVVALRGDVGMTPFEFAELLGIHASTIYRWEKRGPTPVRMDPMQARLLAVLRHVLQRDASVAPVLREALLISGGLYAIYRLLRVVYATGAYPRFA